MTHRHQQQRRESVAPIIEPLEQRLQFSNIVDWALAVIHNQDPKSVTTQPGGYDAKIDLRPFGAK